MASRTRKQQGKSSDDEWTQFPLKGQTFHVSGNPPYAGRDYVIELLQLQGGTIAKSVTAKLDYLLVGRSKSGSKSTAEKKADALNQKPANIELVHDEASFRQLVYPDRAAAIAMLKAGPAAIEHWNKLFAIYEWGGSQQIIDLSGADLRKADLSGAILNHVNVDGCDFREARLHETKIHEVAGANFDKASGNIRLVQARDCTFRGFEAQRDQKFDRAWNLENCDLTRARLTDPAGKWWAKNCCFHKADLSGLNLSDCVLTQSDLKGANLSSAELTGANLRGASLTGADLRNATLINCNLRDAAIDGAKFDGANLVGADLSTLDTSKAKGLTAALAARAVNVGVHVLDLEQAARQADKLETSIDVETRDGVCELRLACDQGGWIIYDYTTDSPDKSRRKFDPKPLSNAMSELASRCLDPRPLATSLTAKASKSPVKGKALKELCLAAWFEIFGQTPPNEEELKQLAKAAKAGDQDLRAALLAELKAGKEGVVKWNQRSHRERQQAAPFRELDLAGLDLRRVRCDELDFQQTNFTGAKLGRASFLGADLKQAKFDRAEAAGAKFREAKLSQASFAGSVLSRCDFRSTTLKQADFRKADLSKSRFDQADLSGADLSTAKLSGAKFDLAKFDEQTAFPKRFKLVDALRWVGGGKDPRLAQKVAALQKKGPIDFDAFMRKLRRDCDSSRLKKSLSMLKADAFQLFAQVENDAVTGVVKSQSDAKLVYACRIDSAGGFACCTQNLNPCGGLRGALCKHLLVLIVGLTKGEEVDPTTINSWVVASRLQAPELDKERMSEVFLKYKGAEAGEIDWRPTETVPEDYYAF